MFSLAMNERLLFFFDQINEARNSVLNLLEQLRDSCFNPPVL